MYQEFPKWVHCVGKESTIVNSAAEEAEYYGEVSETSSETSPEASRDDLIAAAEALGLKVDKRWSDARLSQEIAKKQAE